MEHAKVPSHAPETKHTLTSSAGWESAQLQDSQLLYSNKQQNNHTPIFYVRYKSSAKCSELSVSTPFWGLSEFLVCMQGKCTHTEALSAKIITIFLSAPKIMWMLPFFKIDGCVAAKILFISLHRNTNAWALTHQSHQSRGLRWWQCLAASLQASPSRRSSPRLGWWSSPSPCCWTWQTKQL